MIFGSLPTIFLGAILYITGLINLLRSIEIIAWTTLVFAILLWIADKFKVEKKIESNLNLKSKPESQKANTTGKKKNKNS